MSTNNTNYGKSSLKNNSGTNNTAFGAYSAYSITDSSCNTAVGSNSLFNNTTGDHNTALGAGSLCNNLTGYLNTAVGSSALEGPEEQEGQEENDGHSNVAVGAQSLYSNTGNLNTAVGTYAGKKLKGSSNNNTFLGANTDISGNPSIISNSTAIGVNATIDNSNQIVLGGPNGQNVYPDVYVGANIIMTGDNNNYIQFPDGSKQYLAAGTGATGGGGSNIQDGTYYADYLYWDPINKEWTVGSNNVKLGSEAGQNSDPLFSIAIGPQAAQNSQGNGSIAIGYQAGQNLQGDNSIALGYQAGYTGQGTYSIAIGNQCGYTGQGANSIAHGISSGKNLQGESSIAIGNQAAQNSQGEKSIAMGYQAGFNLQDEYSIALGYQAGYNLQGHHSIALGYKAGYTGQAPNSIVINATTEELNTGTTGCYIKPIRNSSQTTNALFYDTTTGEITYGDNLMGPTGYTGPQSTVTGPTGYTGPQSTVTGPTGPGSNIPSGTGFASYLYWDDINVGEWSIGGLDNVKLGYQSGYTGQGSKAIAIGYQAGQKNQGLNSIAIGYHAGIENLGEYSIAIGHLASAKSQANNTIVINATIDGIAGETANGCYIAPIRQSTNLADFKPLYYNPTTSSCEIVYSDPPTGDSNWTLNTNTNNIYNNNPGKVGIGKTIPLQELDVSGNINYTGSIYYNESRFITSPGLNSISIGKDSFTNYSQGDYSVAIGNNFGFKYPQPNKSIIISALDSSGNEELLFKDSGFYVAPIRDIQIVTSDYKSLYYNPTANSCEIVYSDPPTGDSNWTALGSDIYNNNQGNVGIGTSTPQALLDVSGNIQCQTIITVGVNNGSDYRIKEDIKELDDTFTVDKLRPVTYKNTKTGNQDIGLIAHELQEIFPFLVTGEKDGEKLQTINYISLIPLLIKEIQDLKSTLSTLSTFRKGGAKP